MGGAAAAPIQDDNPWQIRPYCMRDVAEEADRGRTDQEAPCEANRPGRSFFAATSVWGGDVALPAVTSYVKVCWPTSTMSGASKPSALRVPSQGAEQRVGLALDYGHCRLSDAELAASFDCVKAVARRIAARLGIISQYYLK